MTAVVVCNGMIEDYSYIKKYFDKADFVICADGGATHLRKLGIVPDVLLGDFDSILKVDLDYYRESGVEVLKFPYKKDKTDTELAVELAADRGFKDVILVGALGKRQDHSLSNVFILKKMLDRGIKGIIADKHNEIMLVRDRIELKREINLKVTLLSLTEKTEGVNTDGLLYPLTDATLELGSSWGVSNEFAGETAEISVKDGLLLVIKSID